MRKLNILITQYKEDDAFIKPLLDSIEIQQNIDFEDIEVIIGNNGSEVKLTDEFLQHYSYPIKYILFNNTTLGGNRENLMKAADAEYVMWCDADDMFYHALALHKIFQYIEKGFDVLFDDFIQEVKIEDKIYAKVRKEDHIHVHGKVYNRQFLINNQLHWCDKMWYNEDGCFAVLALSLTKRIFRCEEPYYIWKYNPKSKTHSREHNDLLGFTDLMIGYNHLIDGLMNRGFGTEARYYCFYTLLYAYYTFCSPDWKKDWEGKDECRLEIYKSITAFISKYKLLLPYVTDSMKSKANEVTKHIALEKGYEVKDIEEIPNINEWLKSIRIILGD